MLAFKERARTTLKPAWPLEPRTRSQGLAVFFQNCMGLFPNLDLLKAKIAADAWDVIALVETWLPALPGDVQTLLRTFHYQFLSLPATLSCVPGARDKRGIMVFVKDHWHLSSVGARRCDFGELLGFTIAGVCRCVVFYRCALNTIWAYDRTLSLFSNADSCLPTLWVGDFNW